MTVLQLGPFPPPHGGVQSNLEDIWQYLRSHGSRCFVVNLTRYRRNNENDVFYPKTPFGVVFLLLRLRYQIIHIQFGGVVTLRLLGLWLVSTLIPGKRTVLTFHSGGYASWPEGKSARPATLRGLIFRRLDRIIVVNQEMAALFRRFGVAPEKIRLIPPYSFLRKPSDHLRPEIAAFFDSHDPVLTTVSGLEPEYDIPLQIDVIGDLVEKFPRIGLLIVGGGSLALEMRERIHRTAHRDHILLCGDVDHTETLRIIQQSRIVLRTTHFDGDSIAVREALHLGTPVIATDNGMRPEGVHLVHVADRAGCRAKIEELLGRAPESSPDVEMGEENLEAVMELYRELLKQKA